MPPIETDRLTIRPPVEDDRARFVEMFTDPAFTVFATGPHDVESANARFDHMLLMADAIPYAKQPVIVRESGTIVGYTGADSVVLDGIDRLEWGWRLVPEARGRGYATEAASALLAAADRHDDGEMHCLTASDNHASRCVADKVGFQWWRRIEWLDDPADPTDALVRPIGTGGPPLLAPDRI
jgi:RimJ/RimL family protein N-acetyltransferase